MKQSKAAVRGKVTGFHTSIHFLKKNLSATEDSYKKLFRKLKKNLTKEKTKTDTFFSSLLPCPTLSHCYYSLCSPVSIPVYRASWKQIFAP